MLIKIIYIVDETEEHDNGKKKNQKDNE